jgi:hypothetical protein
MNTFRPRDGRMADVAIGGGSRQDAEVQLSWSTPT